MLQRDVWLVIRAHFKSLSYDVGVYSCLWNRHTTSVEMVYTNMCSHLDDVSIREGLSNFSKTRINSIL